MAPPAVGGILAHAVIKEVARMLGSAIGGEIKLHWNCKRDLREMKDTLETIEAVLQDAEMRSITENEVQLWLKRLKEAAYDISDMLDKLEGKAAKVSLVKIPRLPNITVPHEMQKMRRKLKNIVEEHQKFGFRERSTSNGQQLHDNQETWSTIEAPIVGRTEEMKKILSRLPDTTTLGTTVLPIYGIGGIGKTTMAKMVFKDDHFKDFSKVWVYASCNFDLNKIGNSIISQLSKEEGQLTIREMIQSSLRELLFGSSKKILIVLDDLWERNPYELDKLKAMLNVGNGSKVIVIVTTRDEDIANMICTVQPYKLPLLTDGMCWNIIKQKVGFEARSDKDDVESVGREIALKCGGVALAAHALGYMLQSMAVDRWKLVRDNDIWNSKLTWADISNQHHHSVISSLMLSYNSMPPCLKSCFAYCATFPKGYKIVKDDLIYQWISLGFVESTSILSSWQHGEDYVSNLMGMSFLQYSKSPATAGVHQQEVKLLTMHDLVHDMARSVMVDEILDASKQGNTIGSRHRFALLNDCNESLESFKHSLTKIRTLRFLEGENNVLGGTSFSSTKYLHFPICGKNGLHDDVFLSAKYLRVLDLSECSIQQLPNSIGHGKQLRFLKAPRVQHRTIPNCITKLSKLLYLDLCGSSSILKLPKPIGKMKSLMYLDLSGCSGIKFLPKSFAKLSKLEHLDLSNCSNLTWLPEMSSFASLKYLSLSGVNKLKYLPAFFGNLKCLVHLDLSHCDSVGIPEALGGLMKLQYLNLSYCRCDRGLGNVLFNFTELRYMYLPKCLDNIYRYQSFEWMWGNVIESICSLSNLEYLDLSENWVIRHVPDDICNLRKLHTLDLSSCERLSHLPESIQGMDSLRFLSVCGCNKLDKSLVPQFNSSSILSLPFFVVQASDGESKSNLFRLQGVNPPELEIFRLENVKATEEATRIRLMEKHNISTLKLDWTSDAKRFVEDLNMLGELVPPRNVEEFFLQGYNSKYFPAWLMDIAPPHFPNLVRIAMVNLPKCTSLPPLGQLPLLEFMSLEGMHSITKIDGELCGGQSAFRRLRELTLSRMESLKEWCTTPYCGEDGVSKFMFPILEILEIHQCPMLCFHPWPPKVGIWKIDSSDCIVSSWGSPGYSPARAKSLSVESCMLPLHQWRFLNYLTALRCLCIKFCRYLSSSPEMTQVLSSLQLEILYLEVYDQTDLPNWMSELTSLRTLTLSECGTLTSLPEWLGGLTSLCEMRVYNCPNLNNLESMGRVTSLEWICLMDCENIPALPEGMGSLTTLRKLEIIRCEGIKYLPESIHKLTNLRTLDITGCPALSQWCESEENKAKIPHTKDKDEQQWRLCPQRWTGGDTRRL